MEGHCGVPPFVHVGKVPSAPHAIKDIPPDDELEDEEELLDELLEEEDDDELLDDELEELDEEEDELLELDEELLEEEEEEDVDVPSLTHTAGNFAITVDGIAYAIPSDLNLSRYTMYLLSIGSIKTCVLDQK